MKMNLKTKMLVYILTTSSIIYALALGYVSLKSNTIASENAKELTNTYAREYANYVKADLSVDINMARALAQVSKGYKNIDPEDRKEIHKEMLLHLIEGNPNFLSTWYNWELSALWPDWDKPYGRMRLTYYRLGEQILYQEEILDTVPGFTRGAYYDIMDKKVEYVMDPYYYAYQQGKEEILETSVAVPILDGNEAVGMAGFDLPLKRFQDIIVNIHPIEQSYAFLIAYNGQYVAHDNEELVGKFVEGDLGEKTETSELIANIQDGKDFVYTITGEDGKEYWISFAPVYIGESPTPWSFAFAVPVNVIME